MQKQKTIAKWLSIILLTTVAIGCYIALSQVSTTSTETATGADTITNDTPPITYSSLPRKGECIDGINVSHFGGTKEDCTLDYIFFQDKTLVFAKCESIDNDTSEQGIYVAVFCDNTLEKSIHIADADSQYLCCALTQNGLLIFTKTQSETNVILLKNDLSIGGKTSFETCDKIIPLTNGEDVLLLCLSTGILCMRKINFTLNISKDNFVYQTQSNASICALLYGNYTNIFLQESDNVKILQYDTNTGFNIKYSLDKHSLLQVFPIMANNCQNFITLTKSQDCVHINSFDNLLNHISEQSVPNVRNSVAFVDETGIKVLCDNTLFSYCTHLDFIGKNAIELPIDTHNCTSYSPIQGIETAFVANTPKGFCVVDIQSEVSVIFNADNAVLNNIAYTLNGNGQTMLHIFATCNNLNKFSYMAFGKKDVFYLSLTL